MSTEALRSDPGRDLKGLCEAPQGFSSGIFINGICLALIWMKCERIHGKRDMFSEVGNWWDTESYFDLDKETATGMGRFYK